MAELSERSNRDEDFQQLNTFLQQKSKELRQREKELQLKDEELHLKDTIIKKKNEELCTTEEQLCQLQVLAGFCIISLLLKQPLPKFGTCTINLAT